MNLQRLFPFLLTFAGLLSFAASASAKDWGGITIGKDASGNTTVTLQNSRILAKYSSAGMTEFTIKSVAENEVVPIDGFCIDREEKRGPLTAARIVPTGDPDVETVHLEWSGPGDTWSAAGGPSQDVSIFKDEPYLKVDYLSWSVNSQDHCAPGGANDDNARFAIYGADRWYKGMAIGESPVFFDRFPPDVPKDTPKLDDPAPLAYHGSFILGVFNRKNGRGVGRIYPASAVTAIKLIHDWTGTSWEVYPDGATDSLFGDHEPFTSYLFAVTDGAAQAIAEGKRLVDGDLPGASKPARADAARYALNVIVNADGVARQDQIVEAPVDFQAQLRGMGDGDAFDPSTVSVVERDGSGTGYKRMPSQFDPDAESPSKGDVIFEARGPMSAGQTRRFLIRYGTSAGPAHWEPASPPELTMDEVQAHGSRQWRFRSAAMSSLFDRTGGAFSELRDRTGADWIQFDLAPPRDGVHYRGIPNLQNASGAKGIFHPGYGTAVTRLIHSGPLKETIECMTQLGGSGDPPVFTKLADEWKMRWEIYPKYVRCTVLRGSTVTGFDFLYEAAPAGLPFNASQCFSLRPDGTKTYFNQTWQQPISPEWVCFGDDRAAGRLLYYAHHETDEIPDKAFSVLDLLTVFGFARDTPTGITQYPSHFTIGFADGSAWSDASPTIHAAVDGPLVAERASVALGK